MKQDSHVRAYKAAILQAVRTIHTCMDIDIVDENYRKLCKLVGKQQADVYTLGQGY